MIFDFLNFFSVNNSEGRLTDEGMRFGNTLVPVRNGIPRFTPDESYSSGNFSLLRQKHAMLQYDSKNGTTINRNTILERTGWPVSFFKDKTVLECGCGAGPDTESLLSFGSRVMAVDIAGVDVAHENLGSRHDLCLVQADITRLPLTKKSFDIVFCHRVIQHTPDPPGTLRHILSFVKKDGAVFVHSYARNIFQMTSWKYALRPLAARLSPERLYNLIAWYAPAAFKISNIIQRAPFGSHLIYAFFPFRNYRKKPEFKNMSDREILEYGIHDTFDALSPRYDNPIRSRTMRKIAEEMLARRFEVIEKKSITLLRTLH